VAEPIQRVWASGPGGLKHQVGVLQAAHQEGHQRRSLNRTRLHPAIKAQYFPVAHMGVVSASDILATVGAIEKYCTEFGYHEKGILWA
jgi:aspartate aminotransferase-like enzyme